MADTACKNFIFEVVDKTWYKELEDPDTFYMNVTDLKLLENIKYLFWVFIPLMPWKFHN